MKPWFLLTFVLLTGLLFAAPPIEFQQQLAQLKQTPEWYLVQDRIKLLLAEYLGRQNLDWQEIPAYFGGTASLQVNIPGSHAQQTLLFSAQIAGSTSDLLTLLTLIERWQQLPPRQDVTILFLGQEALPQPERLVFSLPPFSHHQESYYQASEDFLATYLPQRPSQMLYLWQQKDERYLLVNEQTPLPWLKSLWESLQPLNLTLRGGGREMSSQQLDAKLEQIYNSQNISITQISLGEDFIKNSRALFSLTDSKHFAKGNDFFYAFSPLGHLLIIKGEILIILIFLLLCCWSVLNLFHLKIKISKKTLLKLLFIIVLTLLCFLLADLILTWLYALLDIPPLAYPKRMTLLKIITTLILFCLMLLMFGHRYTPHPLFSLRCYEFLLLLFSAYMAVVSPLLAPIFIVNLILLTWAGVWGRKGRQLIYTFHVLILTLIFFLIFNSSYFKTVIMGPPLLSKIGSSLSSLPFFFLILTAQQPFRQQRRSSPYLQLTFNIILLSTIFVSLILNFVSTQYYQTNKITINYITDLRQSDRQSTQAVIRSTLPLNHTLFYFGSNQFNNLTGLQARLTSNTTIAQPTTQLTSVPHLQRLSNNLVIDYPQSLRTLQILIPHPAQDLIANFPLHAGSPQSSIIQISQPQFPLQLSWSSPATPTPHPPVEFAATLAKVPIKDSIASPQSLQIKKNSQLYWSLN